MALRWFLKEQGHTYPLDKMRAIGALPSGPVNVVRTDAGESLEKLIDREKPLRSGHNAPGALGPVDGALMMRMLGVPIDFIYGFEGYGDVAIAVERGEIENSSPGIPGYLQTWIPMAESKMIYPLFQLGEINAKGEIVRSPMLPNVPTGYEEYKRIKRAEPAGEDWEAYKVLIGMSALNGAVLAHPDIPAERLSALLDSFAKMISDPSWAQETTRVLGAPTPAVTGDVSEASLQVMVKAPASVVDTLLAAGK